MRAAAAIRRSAAALEPRVQPHRDRAPGPGNQSSSARLPGDCSDDARSRGAARRRACWMSEPAGVCPACRSRSPRRSFTSRCSIACKKSRLSCSRSKPSCALQNIEASRAVSRTIAAPLFDVIVVASLFDTRRFRARDAAPASDVGALVRDEGQHAERRNPGARTVHRVRVTRAVKLRVPRLDAERHLLLLEPCDSRDS